MVELEASSPAQTSTLPPAGLGNTAFLVSSLQEEPALKVWTGEQEQAGPCWVSSISTQRSQGLERPGVKGYIHHLLIIQKVYGRGLNTYSYGQYLKFNIYSRKDIQNIGLGYPGGSNHSSSQ